MRIGSVSRAVPWLLSLCLGVVQAELPVEIRALDACLAEQSPGSAQLALLSGMALRTSYCAVDCDCRWQRCARLGVLRALQRLGAEPRKLACVDAGRVAAEIRNLGGRQRAFLVGAPGAGEVVPEGKEFAVQGPASRRFSEQGLADYSWCIVFKTRLQASDKGVEAALAEAMIDQLRPATGGSCGFRPYPNASFLGTKAWNSWAQDVEFLVPGRGVGQPGVHAWRARLLLEARRSALLALQSHDEPVLSKLLQAQVEALEKLVSLAEELAPRLRIEAERERLAAAISGLAELEAAFFSALSGRLLDGVSTDAEAREALRVDDPIMTLSAAQERKLLVLLKAPNELKRCWAAWALARSATPHQRDALVQALRDPSFAVVECALESLSGNTDFHRNRPIQQLQRASQDLVCEDVVSLQRSLLQSLAASREPAAVEFVLGRLAKALPADPAPWEAWRGWLEALRASAAMATPAVAAETRRQIEQLAFGTGSEALRAVALSALDFDPASMGLLIAEAPPLVRMAALERAGPRELEQARASEDALASALDYLKLPDPHLRAVTMRAIASIGRRASAGVKGGMQAGEARARAACCILLGGMARARDRELLQEARSDSDVWVRSAAGRALLGLPEVR